MCMRCRGIETCTAELQPGSLLVSVAHEMGCIVLSLSCNSQYNVKSSRPMLLATRFYTRAARCSLLAARCSLLLELLAVAARCSQSLFAVGCEQRLRAASLLAASLLAHTASAATASRQHGIYSLSPNYTVEIPFELGFRLRARSSAT